MRRKDIQFTKKDQALRDDVHMLGCLIGDLIKEQGGQELYDFVENTYDTVKTPFHYLMDKVSLLSFSPFRKSEITQIENKKQENKESN